MTGEAIPIIFPAGGISEQGPYADQAGPVAVRSDHVLNVRPFDKIEKRFRGGQRPGMTKFIASAANSSLVQRLVLVVKAADIP